MLSVQDGMFTKRSAEKIVDEGECYQISEGIQEQVIFTVAAMKYINIDHLLLVLRLGIIDIGL